MSERPKRTTPGIVILHGPFLREVDELADASVPLIPPVDLYETRDCYVLSAELPGVEKEDVHVEVRESELTIWGERKVEAYCCDESYHRVEGIRGRFHRTLSLPEAVEDDARIKATLKNGILHVELPKAGRSRSIAVQASRSER